MTLHEAIIKVLVDVNTPLKSDEIADAINEQKLYTRRDSQKLSASQVSARAGNYPELLKINGDGAIEIVNRALHSFRMTYYHILNVFRNTRLSFQDIRFVAACTIYLSWLNVEKPTLKHNPDKDDFIKLFSNVLSNVQPKNAMDTFLSLLEQLTAFELHDVLQFIHTPPSIDKIDTDTFGSFFNDIINDYSSNIDWRAGEASTPNNISKFIGSIYSVAQNGKIFDPFVGFGGTLVQAYRHNFLHNPKIVAGEINARALHIAELNAIANGCERGYFYHKNSFTDWNNSIEADLLITVPPMGGKIQIYGLHDKFPELDNLLTNLGVAFTNSANVDSSTAGVIISLAHLNKNGKAAIVVPNGFLYSNRNDAIYTKQLLVSNNWLDGVISLPAGAFKPFHSVNCSVLLVNKLKKDNFSIFFCDASTNVSEVNNTTYQNIVEIFNNKEKIENFADWISLNDVAFSDFNLDPKRYLTEPLTGDEYTVIKDVVDSLYSGSVVPKTNLNGKEGIPFLQVGDLVESSGLNEIDSSKAGYFISDEELLSKNPKFIPDRAVLVTKIGTKLKASLYKYLNDAICNPQIIVIKTDEKRLLPEYLITQLQSEYLLKQIDSIRRGAGMPHFSQDDFQYLKIKVPSIIEQQKFIASFYGKKLKESEIETEQKQEDDYYNIIASIKHELKQPISSLGMDVTALSEFLEKKVISKKPITFEELIVDLLPGETTNQAKDASVENVLKRMLSAILDASKTLTKTEEILNIGRGSYHPEKFQLKGFLNTVVKPPFANENCTINVLGTEQEIFADKYQLEVLFKRLVENAIKHGFKKGTDKAANIINIRLAGRTQNRDFNEIIVENNGTPFPDGFDINKFQKLGHTSNRRGGSGFGGFHIKRIIESHKGELHIADKNEIGESQFKVKFKIYIP